MRVIKNENIIHVDIDDTLILHYKDNYPDTEWEAFKNPYLGSTILAKRSKKHIELIKYYKARGFYIIAHSGNGWRYTENIIKQLELEKYIDLIHTKNSRYVDDQPCENWMGNRIYLEHT